MKAEKDKFEHDLFIKLNYDPREIRRVWFNHQDISYSFEHFYHSLISWKNSFGIWIYFCAEFSCFHSRLSDVYDLIFRFRVKFGSHFSIKCKQQNKNILSERFWAKIWNFSESFLFTFRESYLGSLYSIIGFAKEYHGTEATNWCQLNPLFDLCA